MICPYCKANLPDGSQFCSKCGQTIATKDNTDNTNRYWKDVDTLNDANEQDRLSAIRKAKSEAQAKTAAFTRKIIAFAAVAVVLILAAISLNASSQKKLESIKADAIGNTYSDTSGGSVMFNGDKKDRITVKIIDEDTLSYTRGNYTLRISSKEGGGYSTSWKQNEIYETAEYEYTFSTSLFGKITLEFNGRSYEVEIDDDDGSIYSIMFYED